MGELRVRGLRGATTVEQNTPLEILGATEELLKIMVKENDLQVEDICSVLFTATKDINAAYPAKAAREMGWHTVPLQCVQEMDVVGSLPMCIRVLIHINTTKTQREMKHIYIKKAISLRPDLAT